MYAQVQKPRQSQNLKANFETSDEWYYYVILQTILKNQSQVKSFFGKIQNTNSVYLIILIYI